MFCFCIISIEFNIEFIKGSMNFKDNSEPLFTVNIIEDSSNHISEVEDEALHEGELQIIQAFQEYTNNYDFKALITFLIETGHTISTNQIFPELTDKSFNILLNHNFFCIFCASLSQLKSIDEKIAAMHLLLSFSTVSPEISDQIYASSEQIVISYLAKDYLPLHHLCLLFCENLAHFPTIAKQMVHDESLISNLCSLYINTPFLERKDKILNIFSRLSEFDQLQYHKFVELALNEQYLSDMLPRDSSIDLLLNLSRRAIKDDKFQNLQFIQALRMSLMNAIKTANKHYVVSCLQFMNIRCENPIEANLYYSMEFIPVFFELPDEFIVYIALILVWIFEMVEEAKNNQELVLALIEKAAGIMQTGNFNEKIACVPLISKMAYKIPQLFDNETVLGIIVSTFDLLFANYQNQSLKRILDLLIAACDYEIMHEKRIIILQIIEKDLIDEISRSIDDEQVDKRIELLKSKVKIK